MARLDLALVVRTVDQATAPLRRIQQSVRQVARQTGIARMGRQLGNVGRQLRNTGEVAQQFGRRMGLLSVAVGAAAFTIGGRFASAGDEVAKTAARLGLGVEELQRLRYAAERAGVPVRTFDMAFQRFTRRTAEAAAGTGEAQGALEALGIQLRDTEGNLRPANSLLNDVADALAALPNQGYRVRAAFKLFDSEGVSMVNMLQDGSGAMRSIASEMDDLGIITAEEAGLAESHTDAMKQFKTSLEGVANALGAKLLPELTPAIEKLTAFIVEMKPKIVEDFELALKNLGDIVEWGKDKWVAISTEVGGFVAKLRETFPELDEWIALGGDMAEEVSWITTVLGGLSAYMSLQLVASIGKLAASMTALFVSPLGAVALAAAAIYLIYENWDGIVAWFKEKWDGVKAAFSGWWEGIVGKFKGYWTDVKAVFDLEALKETLTGFGLRDIFKLWWSGVKAVFSLYWSTITAAFNLVNLGAKLLGFDLKGTITGWFDGIVAWVKGWWRRFDFTIDIPGLINWLSGWSLWGTVAGWVNGVIEWARGWWTKFKAEYPIAAWIEELATQSLSDTIQGWFDGITEWATGWWTDFISIFDFGWLREMFGMEPPDGTEEPVQPGAAGRRARRQGDRPFMGLAAPQSLFGGPLEREELSGAAGRRARRAEARVTVDLRNLPHDARVDTRADSDVDLEVIMGRAMPGIA